MTNFVVKCTSMDCEQWSPLSEWKLDAHLYMGDIHLCLHCPKCGKGRFIQSPDYEVRTEMMHAVFEELNEKWIRKP